MNKKLKKGIVGLLAAPCLFMATGCFGETPPGDTPPTTKTDAEAYAVLRTHVSNKKLDVTLTETVTSVSENKNTMATSVDLTNSGLEGEMLTMMETAMEEQFGDGEEQVSGTRTEYVYKTDKTGYKKEKDYNTTTNAYDTVDTLDLTKKVGNDYINYVYNGPYDMIFNDVPTVVPETKEAFKVDDKYAEATYKVLTDEVFGEDSDAAGILEKVSEFENYEDFLSHASDLAEEYAENMASSDLTLTADQVDTSVDITLTNGVYSLEATVELGDVAMTTPMGSAIMDMSADMKINFTEEGVTGVTMEYSADTTMSMKTKDMGVGVTDETKTIDITMAMGGEMAIKLDESISDATTTMNADYSEYLGTGEEGAIENKEVDVNLEFVGAYYKNGREVKWDTLIAEEFENTTYWGLVVEGYYWDKECTEAVREATDKVPSTGCTLYVKVTPAIGHAIVNIDYLGDDYTTYQALDTNLETTYTFSATRYGGTEVLTKLVIDGTEVTLTEDEDYVLTVEALHTYNVEATYEEVASTPAE